MEKRTSIEFAKYRLERAKEDKDVLAYFNKNYVKTEIFPRQIGRRIVLASKIREDSDYDDKYEPSSESTHSQIGTSRELIELVEKYEKV